MNANEMTAIRELTVDEQNMVAGGRDKDLGYYHFTVLGITLRGDITGGCASWSDGNGGREGFCW